MAALLEVSFLGVSILISVGGVGNVRTFVGDGDRVGLGATLLS
jgi:hypothetical protein